MLFSLHLVLSKYIKIQDQEIPSIDCNVLEFFCAPYTDYLSYFHEKFQVELNTIET